MFHEIPSKTYEAIYLSTNAHAQTDRQIEPYIYFKKARETPKLLLVFDR